MAESIINDWLSDYALLESSEIRSFAAQHEHNHEVASALFTVLNERLKYPDLLHSICNQFFNFYRSNETDLKKFTLQFLPTLIYIYLNSVAQGDKRSCRSVETLLLSIYNIEISGDDGQPKTISFRMPVLAQPSIYHEEKNLNASDLRRWEENSNKEVNWGPLQQVESINAQNRIKIMTALLFSYNQQLSLIQKSALSHLCRAASMLVNQGFFKMGHAHRISYGSDPANAIVSKPLPRIPVSSQFLLELLHAVYFAMFNDFGTIAIQTVDDIYNRACYELFPEVILVTNAIKNSLHANPSGQPSDGPMGLSVALTPSTQTTTVSKSMITNASFRTKKLPDDIPIQGPKDDNNSGQLVSISEELESDLSLGSRNTVTRSSKEGAKIPKVPFPGFKKSKDKDKDKDAKITMSKNGISFDAGKDLQLRIMNKKEKFVNRGLVQSSTDFTDALDRISPTALLKRKNSHIDINLSTSSSVGGIDSFHTVASSTEPSSMQSSKSISLHNTAAAAATTTTTTVDSSFHSSASIECNSMQTFANGIKDEKLIEVNNKNILVDGSDAKDSSPDLISIGTQRPSIVVDLTSHNNIQISKV